MRYLIDLANGFVGRIRKGHTFKPKGRVIKVNIGSGLSVADGWINVDASLNAFFSKWPRFFLNALYSASGTKQHYSFQEYYRILRNNLFVHHNVEYGIPFPDESVDCLYSSHFLEHLFRDDARRLVKEAHRVLKKGGIIRICVPNLEYAVSLYQKGEKEKTLSYFFVDSKYGYFHQHKYMYDFDTLKQLFEEAGFINIERCLYRQGKTPDIDLLDNRPEETLYVEANK